MLEEQLESGGWAPTIEFDGMKTMLSIGECPTPWKKLYFFINGQKSTVLGVGKLN